jgi:hypothetical protein
MGIRARTTAAVLVLVAAALVSVQTGPTSSAVTSHGAAIVAASPQPGTLDTPSYHVSHSGDVLPALGLLVGILVMLGATTKARRWMHHL